IDFGPYGAEESVKTETNFFVTCKLNSSMPSANMATYKWFKVDNTEVTSRDSITRVYVVDRSPGLELNLEPVQDEDAGRYRCVASVGGQTYERQLFLTVRATITFNDCLTEQFGVVGHRSEIMCSASGGEGTLSTEWRKEGVVGTLVTNNEYAIETKKLVVLQTTAASAGTYTYYASASTEKKSQRITLKALTIPAIVQPLLSKKAVVGNTAEMFCMARGNPSPRIDWFKVDENGNQVRMQTDNRITIEERNVDGDTQGIMMIKNVQKEDESYYACKAYNKATEILGSATIPETKSNLDVQTIPTIGEFQDTTNGQYQGREGASVTMKCEARGDPRPVVVWTKVGSNHQYTEGQNSETVSVTKEDIADPNNPGVRLSLGLKGLEASAFGNYTCTARNEAGEVSKNVKLEVLFSPNFDGQDTDYGRVFYTWKGNTDGNFGKVVCVANGNPQPVFNWYKDGTEIVQGTSGYGLSEEKSTDPRYPYRHISKLSVSYNGANDNIFGTYTCRATNNIKPNNQTLQLKRAEVPGMPVVTIQEEKPTVLTFWLMEPNVEGPEVTQFKVTYKLTGGPSEPVELIIPKEFRDYIDVNKKYTVAIINQLEPNKDYTFNFYAENNVGIGVSKEMKKRTPPITTPSAAVIKTNINSADSTRIRVIWDPPNDGGAVILHYKVTWKQVAVRPSNQTLDSQGYVLDYQLTDDTFVEDIKDSEFNINGLIPGSYYQVQVYAKNSLGYGMPGISIIKTREAEDMVAASTGVTVSTGIIICIVVGIFLVLLIIVDVICCVKNRCGIIMCIREKVGGHSSEDGYSAAKTDDVENLAKRDELMEEVKAAEEENLENAEDEKKEPLLPDEQQVDTVDESEPAHEVKELEPEDKTEQLEAPASEKPPAETDTQSPTQEEASSTPGETPESRPSEGD
ncbi:hypothetical protein DPMN_031592, partial [Dreissena polymorpha]